MEEMSMRTGLGLAIGIVLTVGCLAESRAAPAPGGAGSSAPGSIPPADVYLEPGDDLQQAVSDHAAGTVFVLRSGVYPQATVNPKSGQVFWGEKGVVLDGENAKSAAFNSSASNVEIHNLRIERYRDNGIRFNGGSGTWVDRVTVYDTGSGDGEANGAVRFDDAANIKVTDCYFERVSSGVLPTSCTGPIVIEHNKGLNIGRNMVQLAACSGAGIRVRFNSMERDGTYVRPGNDDVEDWISVWRGKGLPDDYAEISFNRARGHGPSGSASFIMLGDGGGEYQRARWNIGVTPGQVGIGLSGGRFIEVTDNLMYSGTWSNNNIAYYSANYGSGPCGDHAVRRNRANWTNRDNISNSFWSDGNCTPLDSSDNIFPDRALDESIWDDWPKLVREAQGTAVTPRPWGEVKKGIEP
jgi:hypothetical protein